MIKASKVIEILEKQVTRLKKFSDEDLSGFVLIVPPEGTPVNYVVMESTDDIPAFYQNLNNRIKTSIESSQYGGVSVPGMPRR